jgi:hypothetical protein
MQVWLDRWLSKTCEAVRAFAGIYDLHETKTALESAPLEKIADRVQRLAERWHETYIKPLGLKLDIDLLKSLMGA